MEHTEREDLFRLEADKLEAALVYLAENEPKWVLDPNTIQVQQPANHAEILKNIRDRLGTLQDGARLLTILKYNLNQIRAFYGDGSGGFSHLGLKADFSLRELNMKDLKGHEQVALEQHSQMELEDLEFYPEPGPIMVALLDATGAMCLRDDIADGNHLGQKVYKGMMDDKVVYFVESIGPTFTVDNFGLYHEVGRARRFMVIGASWVAEYLDELSDNDKKVVNEIGITIPYINAHDYNPKNYPTRSRLAETLRLYIATCAE